MTETADIRLKRLAMRSMRRGIKEMDIILGGFADDALADLSPEMLDRYEALLSENDHDLYAWVTRTQDTPSEYTALLDRIRTHTEQAVSPT